MEREAKFVSDHKNMKKEKRKDPSMEPCGDISL